MATVPVREIEFINVYEAITHSSDRCCRNAYEEIKNSFSRPEFQEKVMERARGECNVFNRYMKYTVILWKQGS